MDDDIVLLRPVSKVFSLCNDGVQLGWEKLVAEVVDDDARRANVTHGVDAESNRFPMSTLNPGQLK